jgi:hypothetical protein
MTEALAEPTEMDRAEMAVAALPPAVVPITNIFTPGIYARQVFIPAGVALVTREHLVEHPFVISAGIVEVEDEKGNREILRAPHTGITKPGTRRKLVAHESTVWTTFHPNPSNETDPDKLVLEYTGEHRNPLAPQDDPRFRMWSKEVTPSLTTTPLLTS